MMKLAELRSTSVKLNISTNTVRRPMRVPLVDLVVSTLNMRWEASEETDAAPLTTVMAVPVPKLSVTVMRTLYDDPIPAVVGVIQLPLFTPLTLPYALVSHVPSDLMTNCENAVAGPLSE